MRRRQGGTIVTRTDVLDRLEQEPDEGPPRFRWRRLVRWVTVLVVGILAVLAVWQDPLYALH
jgi:hypothetical protein